MNSSTKTLDTLRLLHGRNIVRDDREVHPVIPTGWGNLDCALGCGGWPRGRISEIYGRPSSGKTTMGLRAVASAQARGGRAVFVDAERSLNYHSATELGVDIREMILCEPDTAEAAFDSISRLVTDLRPELVVLDSLAALVPKHEYDDASFPDANYAALIGRSLRLLGVQCSRSMTCLLILNQVRTRAGLLFGDPTTTPGGNSLRHATYLRVEMRPVKRPTSKGMPRRELVRAVIVKSKFCAAFEQVEFELPYGGGRECPLDRRK